MNGLQAMIHPTIIRRPDDDGTAGSKKNDDLDNSNSLFRTAASTEAAMPPSNEESLHDTGAAAETASPLDDFLSGEHKYPFGFTISIPATCEHDRNEAGSCDESIVSGLTLMTYRAELMKQAIIIEFEKFRLRQQKKQQGAEEPPEAIRTMFARKISCPDTQESMTSFVNITSAKMKTEACQHQHLEEEDEHYATSDPIIQRRVDELFVEFGVRPARLIIPYEIPEENTSRISSSNEQRAVTDYHLDSVIQMKLQLAEKQAILEALSSKYNALLLQKSWQNDILNENSSLRRENERLREQLRQAGITSTAPIRNSLWTSSFYLAEGDLLTTRSPSQPSDTFNVDDREQSIIDATNDAYQTPLNLQEFKLFRKTSRATATDSSSTENESPPLLQSQPSLKPLNSFSKIIQGWRNRPTTTMAMELDDGCLHRSLTGRMGSTNMNSNDISHRRRGNRIGWTSASMQERPPPVL